jgi:hypothetical protein
VHLDTLFRYWNIWRIDPAGDRVGFKCAAVPAAQAFLQTQQLGNNTRISLTTEDKNITIALLSWFQDSTHDAVARSQSGLCLRCYVSESILNACRKLDNLFGGDQFTYRDLLPFVLNDDGKSMILLDQDHKSQLLLDLDGSLQATACNFFSVQILQTFKPNGSSSMSLNNWAYLQTKQNSDLKNFLSEFGFRQLSDWALLNRARTKQLKQLADHDSQLIEVFHAVYRRDRCQQHQGTKRCLDPTAQQLQEMVAHLQVRNIIMQPYELITALRRVAMQLRQYDLWSYREPLELDDPETGERTIRSDLPYDAASESDLERQEQQELLVFFYEQLQLALVNSIQQAIHDRIIYLRNSKSYITFADQLVTGLSMYYHQGIALKEIAGLLNMSGWAQARRILNPGELLSSVRTATIRQVLHQLLKKAEEKGLTPLPPKPDYLEQLAEQIETIADAEIFQDAFDEIQAGKNRLMKSVYAQQLCHYLEEHQKLQLEFSNV